MENINFETITHTYVYLRLVDIKPTPKNIQKFLRLKVNDLYVIKKYLQLLQKTNEIA